jgi:hypothetical protein
VVSVGVKVTPSLGAPAPGAVVEVVQEKEPVTDAVPPLRVDEASVWPYVIALAVGHADTVGVVLEGGGFPPPPLLPPHAAMVRLKRIDNPIETLRLAFIMVQCFPSQGEIFFFRTKFEVPQA